MSERLDRAAEKAQEKLKRLRARKYQDKTRTKREQQRLRADIARRARIARENLRARIAATNYFFDVAQTDTITDAYAADLIAQLHSGRKNPPQFWNEYVARSAKIGERQFKVAARPFLSTHLLAADLPQTIAAGEIINKRIFNGMRGFTDDAVKTTREILARALTEGTNPKIAATRLNGILNWLQTYRAERIARTEMAYARNLAYLQNADSLTIGGHKPRYVWLSALSATTRAHHAKRHNRIFTAAQITQLIGEPNCQCSTAFISPRDERYAKAEKSIGPFLP